MHWLRCHIRQASEEEHRESGLVATMRRCNSGRSRNMADNDEEMLEAVGDRLKQEFTDDNDRLPALMVKLLFAVEAAEAARR